MTGFQGMVGFDISYGFIRRAGMVENHPWYNCLLTLKASQRLWHMFSVLQCWVIQQYVLVSPTRPLISLMSYLCHTYLAFQWYAVSRTTSRDLLLTYITYVMKPQNKVTSIYHVLASLYHCTEYATWDWAAEWLLQRLRTDWSRLRNDFVVKWASNSHHRFNTGNNGTQFIVSCLTSS